MKSPWTEANVVVLKNLWTVQRLTANRIAEIMKVTRNAVLGKVHRMGLPKTHVADCSRVQKLEAERPIELPIVVGRSDYIPDPMFFDPTDPAEKYRCRFPIGEPSPGGIWKYCTERSKNGKPYCEDHAEIAYQPKATRGQKSGGDSRNSTSE